jgi:hypothetical protein
VGALLCCYSRTATEANILKMVMLQTTFRAFTPQSEETYSMVTANRFGYRLLA